MNSGVPDYDFGDGPKESFAGKLQTTPRTYCMMRSTGARDAPLCRDGTDKAVDPVEPYDIDVGRNISIARNIELTGIEYAQMRSKVQRFEAPDPLNDQDFGGQNLKTIGKELKETPRRYHNVGTKTARFPNPADNQAHRPSNPLVESSYVADRAGCRVGRTSMKLTRPTRSRLGQA